MKNAATPPHKQGYLRFLRWLTRQVEQHGVQVRLGAHATQETVANERPDAIVVATGAKPMIPPIPGIERAVNGRSPVPQLLPGQSAAAASCQVFACVPLIQFPGR